MTNNILVFRTDRIGDLLITCPAIVTIKKHFPNSSITMIASRKNYDYAKGLKIFEDVYIFPQSGLLKKINFIYNLSRKKFDYILIFDGKDRSIISSIFIQSQHKVAIIAKKRLNFIWRLFKIKFVGDNEKTDLIKIFQEVINNCKINVNINNYNFLTQKEDNNFSSEINVNNYIHIHLDEKWFNHLYISTYKKINPSYNEFIDFINDCSINGNVLITTGLVNFELIEDLKNKFFKKKTEKIYYNKNSASSIYLIYRPTLEDLESILRKAKILISCHGAITHIANSFNIKILDIIDEDRKEWYQRFSSYLKQYSIIYRQTFSEMKNILLNNMVDRIKNKNA